MGARSWRIIAISCLSGILLACEFVDVASGQDYEYVGNGVGYRPLTRRGNVFIGYPGWSVSETLGRHWVDRLVEKSDLTTRLGVGHVYAIKGPDDVDYQSQEVANSALIRHLLEYADSVETIIVAAHSSGAFVANEFFTQLYDWGVDSAGLTSGKVVYFNLDGAGGYSPQVEANLRNLFFVYARSGNLSSMNSGTMTQLGDADQEIELNASSSGCLNKYCLHDVMIIQTPWDPEYFDLDSDYGLFSIGEREVQMTYLDYIQ